MQFPKLRGFPDARQNCKQTLMTSKAFWKDLSSSVTESPRHFNCIPPLQFGVRLHLMTSGNSKSPVKNLTKPDLVVDNLDEVCGF